MAQSALERDPALRTPALYGHPVNTDTFYGPSVSVFTGFDCLDFQDLAGGRSLGPQQSCRLSLFQIRSYGPESIRHFRIA